MNNSAAYYFDTLYPYQDRILKIIQGTDTGFYLTGGTAASRGYLNHRFSDDLDLFVNDNPNFLLWSERIIQSLEKADCGRLAVNQKEERFVRLALTQPNWVFKIEMVNDVPAHVGTIQNHPVLGRLDSAENILANKITALLDREEPKDLADIWGFCCQMALSITDAITNAQSQFSPPIWRASFVLPATQIGRLYAGLILLMLIFSLRS
jgi:predicted nucleotidyltransferase component of viral defense system